ncbi:MAG: hypothetical protein GY754_25200 [bacterium]|nr:hypothetical protein [bacterium]
MKVYTKGKKPISLTKNHYKSAGGEGTIYCKGKTAYKIYNDPQNMIPIEKIEELKEINIDNVLGPEEVLYDSTSDEPAGFTMPFIKETEFLCKLFTRSFRDKNNITPQMIADLVKKMQETLMEIHQKGFLVVDYNEMNFLVDKTFSTPYYIDVNSYQTATCPATALMESVRDRQPPKNEFSELTDWFSFAIVSFQLYTGCHPYKGRHADYSSKEIASLKMMDDNISVFHPGVRLPANSQDLALIPQPHLDWYTRIFLNNERSIPPFYDAQVPAAIAIPAIITGTEKFMIDCLDTCDKPLLGVYYFNGVRYALTAESVYAGKNIVRELEIAPVVRELFAAEGGEPGLAELDKEKKEIRFSTLPGTHIGTLKADDSMEMNGMIYTVHNGTLLENSFMQMSQGEKVLHSTKQVGDIFEPAWQMFKGVIIQDIFSTCWMAIPYKPGACANVHIQELDGSRIIDALYDSGHTSNIAIVLAEKNGVYSRYTFCFTGNCSAYTRRVENDVDIDSINFTVLSNGLCVSVIHDTTVEAFFNNSEIKLIEDPPFDSSMRLAKEGSKALFINKEKLYRVSLKNS